MHCDTPPFSAARTRVGPQENARGRALRWQSVVAGAVFFASQAAPLAAFEFSGAKTVTLVESDGTAHVVADITFDETGSYKISWRDETFGDHFLSMRPFKCLEGETKYWCRVPYPYDIKRQVSGSDLTDLEYDLLFVWKGSKEYGINMWNGVYYRLESEDGRLVGTLSEMDLAKLASPPEDGNLRPIRDADLQPGEPDSHWLPGLVIE